MELLSWWWLLLLIFKLGLFPHFSRGEHLWRLAILGPFLAPLRGRLPHPGCRYLKASKLWLQQLNGNPRTLPNIGIHN